MNSTINPVPVLRPFTTNSLSEIQWKIQSSKKYRKANEYGNEIAETQEEQNTWPNCYMEEEMQLPVRLSAVFVPELANKPLQEIDSFYRNDATFVTVNKDKKILRFSAADSLWLLSPLNPVRRVAIFILCQRFYYIFMLITVLTNCYFMTHPLSPTTESAELLFLAIYTLEACIKIMARGFVLEKFTYLRDPWNWLDFFIVWHGYLTIGVYGNFLNAFAVVRVYKVIALMPGLKTIVRAIYVSALNLRDVIIVSLFSLTIFSVVAMQLYMGILTQKCIKDFPNDSALNHSEYAERLTAHNQHSSNWLWNAHSQEYVLCSNSTMASCPGNYTCRAGFGGNPDYGYTSFDNFGSSFLASCRLFFAHVDVWDKLYEQILLTAGLWNALYFVLFIFFAALPCMNLFIATMAMSYDELQQKAVQEEQAYAEELELMKEEAKMDAADLAKTLDPQTDQIVVTNIAPKASAETIDSFNEGAEPKLDSENGQLPQKFDSKKNVANTLTDKFCIWDCCGPWRKLQKCVSAIIFDPFALLFTTLTVIVNIIFMAANYHGLEGDTWLKNTRKIGHKVFTTIYTIEVAMKMIAMSPKNFFRVKFYVFDFAVTILSLIELCFDDSNLPGIVLLHSLRLLRMFKLAEVWPNLRTIILIMSKVMGALGNLTFILMIVTFSFAAFGMQVFSNIYIDNVAMFRYGEMPRWNFTDFWHSWLIIFRILCGQWIETMWDCWLVCGWPCIPFFASAVIVGNLIVFRLFQVLLLSSFGMSNLRYKREEPEDRKLKIAFRRIRTFFKAPFVYIHSKLPGIKQGNVKIKGDLGHIGAAELHPLKEQEQAEKIEIMSPFGDTEIKINIMENPIQEDESQGLASCRSENYKLEEAPSDEDSDRANPEIDADEKPPECCPARVYKIIPGCATSGDTPQWSTLRSKIYRIVDHKYFEWVVVIVLILSSVALTLEDIYLKKNGTLSSVLYHLDWIFTKLFLLEMIFKIFGLGCNTYFTNGWCMLDFTITVFSIINSSAILCGFDQNEVFRTVRILRALRPIRLIPRLQGLRVVADALLLGIPSVINVLLPCLYFWLMFAILGVYLFSGKFYKCMDYSFIPGIPVDFRMVRGRDNCLTANLTWENSMMNFDHVGKAYLSLLQVATFRGWVEIMNDATDSRMVDEQPFREINFGMYIYFVIFIIFGSFFILRLFIGAVIDVYNENKRRMGGSLEMFMTEGQKRYYNAMKKMGRAELMKDIPKPEWKPQAWAYAIVTHKKFELIMLLVLGINVFTMAIDQYQSCQILQEVLMVSNFIFIFIFAFECLLKIFALRLHYFKRVWNLFDFAVAILSILSLVFPDLIEAYFVSPNLLRMIRLLRIFQILRLIPGTKGIRTLLEGFIMALPALFTTGLLLFLIMTVYALFGMFLFMKLKFYGGFGDIFNFKTFGQAMIILFQISTSAGWDRILDSLLRGIAECVESESGEYWTCPSSFTAISYIVSYIVINFFIVLHMFIAIILENYSNATEEVQEGLTDDDYDSFYEKWTKFDPEYNTFIRYDQLSDFFNSLEPPFLIEKPNKYRIIAMDITIYAGDKIFHTDILNALTKDFFARRGNDAADILEINREGIWPGRPVLESSTLWRERQIYCAKIIQMAWRKHKLNAIGPGQGNSSG